MIKEIWKQSEINLYEVSNLGRIRNKTNKRVKKLETNFKGYLLVTYEEHSKKKHFKVHRLVALAFIPNTEQKPQVDHINGNKTDNRVSNLRWATNKENAMYRKMLNDSKKD